MVKTPKIYFLDSGILSHTLRVQTVNKLDNSHYKGEIIETFVYAELKKHFNMSESFFKFNYYRTKNKNEIDFILESSSYILAIEVKGSKTVKVDDFKHIIEFDKSISDKKVVGIVLYFGERVISFKKKFWAIPMKVFF